MFIIYTQRGSLYASAAVSKRNGSKTSMQYTYLGKVIDKEAGIYQSRERGVFTFDPATGLFGEVPEDFVFPEDHSQKKKERASLDFGDSYFVNQFLYQSGMMDVIDKIGYGNTDTLHAMVLFYILSSLANVNAISWYSGNFVSLLYPKANMTGQRISDFLAAIGTPERQMIYQKAYIDYVFHHYSQDKNILIDSTGLPNDIHMYYTETNVHNGTVNHEARLIYVVQKSTGLPLFYRAVPGNIVDVSTLERIFLHLDSLGIDIETCIIDAGYDSGDNLDLFYTEDHVCKIDFITRTKSSATVFKNMVAEELSTLEEKENFVKYADRYLFIKRKEIFVGANKNNPAYLYLGLDYAQLSAQQQRLIKRAKKEKLTLDEVYDAMQGQGLFGVISGKKYECEDILPAYYQRQAVEQIFDFAKNNTKCLPLRTKNTNTFQGHLLLSYIASCVVKMIQMRLKVANLFFDARLNDMRNQKCTIYKTRIVTDTPKKEANATYAAFGMKCPAAMPIVNGVLVWERPESDTIPPEKKSRKKAGTKTSEAKPQQENAKRKPGRPKGSKNKKTLEREAAQQAIPSQPKRGPGRPKGSKNKKTLEKEAAQQSLPVPPKRRPGRPKGSKNKKTLEREAKEKAIL